MSQAFDKIFKDIKNIQILQPVKDPEEVLKYFLYITKYRDKNKNKEALKQKNLLFSPDTGLEKKRIIIVRLAGLDSIEARKILQQYAKQADDELQDWISIALQENSALLQSSFLGEPQILISSGLGGKNNKLRYFVILQKKDSSEFETWQKKLVTKEINFVLEQKNCELELIEFGSHFVRLFALIPFNLDAPGIIRYIIDNINEIGNFIDEKFILQNDEILSLEASEKLLNKLNEKDTAQKDDFPDDFEQTFFDWDDPGAFGPDNDSQNNQNNDPSQDNKPDDKQ